MTGFTIFVIPTVSEQAIAIPKAVLPNFLCISIPASSSRIIAETISHVILAGIARNISAKEQLKAVDKNSLLENRSSPITPFTIEFKSELTIPKRPLRILQKNDCNRSCAPRTTLFFTPSINPPKR